MKKILSTILCLSSLAMLITCNNKIDANGLIEETNLNNQKGISILSNRKEVNNEELTHSKMFVQYGINTNKESEGYGCYYLRFATALKGKVESIEYTRKIDNYDDKVLFASTIYSGISANGKIYYYDELNQNITEDETYKNQYYWTCYTIKFKKESEFKSKNISLSLKVNNINLFETPYVTSLINELETDRKFEINDITLEEVNNKPYYILKGTSFGYSENEIYVDLYGNKSAKDYAKDHEVVEIDYLNNTFKISIDLSDVPLDQDYLWPHYYLNGKKEDIKDNTNSSNGKQIIINNKKYSILCDNNTTGHMPVLKVNNIETKFEVEHIGLKVENEKVLYYVNGISKGYCLEDLKINLIKGSTDWAKGNYTVQINGETNTFAFLIDITNYGITDYSTQGMPHIYVNGKGIPAPAGNTAGDLLIGSRLENAFVDYSNYRYKIVNKYNMASLVVENRPLDIEKIGVKEINNKVYFYITGNSYLRTESEIATFDLNGLTSYGSEEEKINIIPGDKNMYEVLIDITDAEADINSGKVDEKGFYFLHCKELKGIVVGNDSAGDVKYINNGILVEFDKNVVEYNNKIYKVQKHSWGHAVLSVLSK